MESKEQVPHSVLAFIAAMMFHRESMVQIAALEAAVSAAKLEPIVGLQMLPVLVYLLQKTTSGQACIPNPNLISA